MDLPSRPERLWIGLGFGAALLISVCVLGPERGESSAAPAIPLAELPGAGPERASPARPPEPSAGEGAEAPPASAATTGVATVGSQRLASLTRALAPFRDASHTHETDADSDRDLEPLREELDALVAPLASKVEVSIHIRELGVGRVLFDASGDRALNPASNHKLVTSGAALDLLGADYVFETQVFVEGQTLYLVGGGDPTLDTDALAELAAEVAAAIPVAPLRELVVDESAFTPRRLGPGYASEGPGASYMAPSGALSLNFNTVEVIVRRGEDKERPEVKLLADSSHFVLTNTARLGPGPTKLELRSVPLPALATELGSGRETQRTRLIVRGVLDRAEREHKLRRRVVDPAMYTGGAFAAQLARASKTPRLPVRPGELPSRVGVELEPRRPVAVRRSAPLHEVVGRMLTYSNNFMAEQLLRTLGWRLSGAPGSWINGGEVLRGYWAAIGNPAEQLEFENGSGLSERGRVTSRGLVELMLAGMQTQAAGARLVDALPVAGAAGTLGGRLQRTRRRVRAKTGTLDGAGGLSGVITDKKGEPMVVFSILINAKAGAQLGAARRRGVEDSIVLAVLAHLDAQAVATRRAPAAESPLLVPVPAVLEDLH